MFFKGHLAGGAGPAGAGKDPGRDFLGLRFTDILHLWLSGQQQPADWPTLAGWILGWVDPGPLTLAALAINGLRGTGRGHPHLTITERRPGLRTLEPIWLHLLKGLWRT